MRPSRLPPTPAVVAVTAAGALPVYLTGALAVLAGPELGFGPGGLGALVATAFAVAGVTTWMTGRVADRVPPPRLMRGSALLAALSMGLAAVAPTYAVLAVAMVLGGLANGLGQPASNALLSSAVARRHRGRAFGLKQSAIPLSILVAGAVVPLVAVPFGWRAGYAVAVGVAVLVALLVPAVRPRSGDDGAGPTVRPRWQPLAVLAVGTGLGAAAGNVLGGFLVPYAVQSGMTPGQAGALAAVCSAAGVLSRVLVGENADRRGGRHLGRVAALLAGGSAGFLLLALHAETIPRSASWVPVLAAGSLLVYVAGWSWAGLLGFAVALAHPGAAGRATAVTQGGVGIGGAVGPLLAGYVVGQAGYAWGWLLACAFTLAAAGAVLLGRSLLLADPRVAELAAAEWRRSAR